MSRLAVSLVLSCLILGCQVSAGDDSSTATGLPTTGVEGGTSGTMSTTDPTTSSTTDPTDPTTSGEAETTDTDTAGEDNNYCVHQCQGDVDCQVNGMDSGLVCVDSTCLSEVDASCDDDQDCVELLSGWTAGIACTSGGGECEASMQICLDIDGEGHCALAPSDFFQCADASFDEIPTTDIDGNAVVVCGRANAACHPDSYCYLPCENDVDCISDAYPACNVGTGLCECSTDADCQTLGSAQFGSCNDGVCGCSSDDDCLAAAVGDICNDFGACGCTSDAACSGVESPYDGGMVECVAF